MVLFSLEQNLGVGGGVGGFVKMLLLLLLLLLQHQEYAEYLSLWVWLICLSNKLSKPCTLRSEFRHRCLFLDSALCAHISTSYA